MYKTETYFISDNCQGIFSSSNLVACNYTRVSCLQTLQGACAHQRQKARLVSWSTAAITLSIEAFLIFVLFVYNR